MRRVRTEIKSSEDARRFAQDYDRAISEHLRRQGAVVARSQSGVTSLWLRDSSEVWWQYTPTAGTGALAVTGPYTEADIPE